MAVTHSLHAHGSKTRAPAGWSMPLRGIAPAVINSPSSGCVLSIPVVARSNPLDSRRMDCRGLGEIPRSRPREGTTCEPTDCQRGDWRTAAESSQVGPPRRDSETCPGGGGVGSNYLAAPELGSAAPGMRSDCRGVAGMLAVIPGGVAMKASESSPEGGKRRGLSVPFSVR